MTEYTFDTNLFSDFHKDVYGFRPSVDHVFYSSSDAEKQEYWDFLMEEGDRVMKMEELAEKQAIKEFETKILELIEMGAGDRETAIRWIADSYDKYDTYGYICWDFGIPYSYEKEFEIAMFNQKRLAEVC